MACTRSRIIARSQQAEEQQRKSMTNERLPMAAPINHMGQASRSATLNSASRKIHDSIKNRPYLVKREHVTRNVSLCESRSSISKQVSPFPFECLECGRISKSRIPFRHRVHRDVGL